MNDTTNMATTAALRKYKRYPAYSDSGIEWLGVVPGHWEIKRIRDVAQSLQTGPFGSQLHADEYVVGGHPVINPANLCDGRVVKDPECTVDDATAARLERYRLREGDILFARRGELGRCGLVARDQDGWLCGTGSLRLRVNVAFATPRFLIRMLSTAGVADWLSLQAIGATMQNLNTFIIGRIPVVVPPVAEQRAIADFLGWKTARIDALVAKKERLIKLLQEKRTALITRSVTKGLDPNVPMKDSGVGWLGEIPAHWDVKKWRYCCHITEGQVAPDDDRFRDRVMIAPNHIESGTGRILYTETANEQGAISGKYLVKPGDIIYSKIRPALNKACIATGEWLCSADMYPVEITAKALSSSFLLYFILSEPFVRLIVDDSMRVAMPKVNREKLAACPLVLPSPADQHHIVAFLDQKMATIDALIAKVRKAIDRINELRTALTSAAVTGKIDVREEVA